ncbi:MAG: mechanosensitive ion channel family protein [Alphaproteobacteria bacterium]
MARLMRLAVTAFIVIAGCVLQGALAARTALAENPAAEASSKETPNQIKLLLDLLADPTVQRWIEEQRGEAAAPAPTEAKVLPSHFLATQIDQARARFTTLADSFPKLTDDLARGWIIMGLEFKERGLIKIAVLIIAFLALGVGAEQLYYRILASVERWIVTLPLETVQQRLRAISVRLAFGTGIVAAFAIGSIGAFLALDWPPLLREIVLGYLIAIVAVRLVLAFGRFLLAPGGERFRILPMSTPAAYFWFRRTSLIAAWLAFVSVTASLLATLGFAPESLRTIADLNALGVLILMLEANWRAPREASDVTAHGRRVQLLLLSLYLVALWILFVSHLLPLFWLVMLLVAVPAAIGAVERSINHVLRPAATGPIETSTLAVAVLERGLRAMLIIGAALFLAHAWQISLVELTARDTIMTRLLRGTLNAVVILLIADVAWHVMRALFDRKLAAAESTGKVDSEDAQRSARLRTLLPILRNILFAVFAVMVVLMVLSAVGIEIGPLIAGAGVVGVAIGFGAQTLVKDIISGIFYLLDDAFRVGEYIQSGSHKGTVESFSLRSVKLRHHRGPLTTVPFGELGAVQNLSRDWVIDKLTIGVTYDSDLDKARKLVKQVGKELAEDPEFAPHIIETLKMQGVEQFGDFAVQLRLKMTTKPGEQFPIRRRAYTLIKKAFDANGIKFAFPTVQVAGGDETAAAARQALDLSKPAPNTSS